MSAITAIEAPRRGSKRRRLVIDEEPWRETSSEVVATLELSEGQAVDLPGLEKALEEAEPSCAKERALRLLAYRERSSRDLLRRLLDDGYPETTAAAVVRGFTDVGFVDDARFAASLAHSRTSRGLGRTRTLRDLAAAGVDEETAVAAVDEALPAEDEAVSAGEFAHRAARRRGATVEKVAAALVRRGYRAGLAFEAAREALRTCRAEEPVSDLDDAADADAFHPDFD